MDLTYTLHKDRPNPHAPKPKPTAPKAPRTTPVPRTLQGSTTVIHFDPDLTYAAQGHTLLTENLPFLQFFYKLLPSKALSQPEALSATLAIFVNECEVLRVTLSPDKETFQVPLATTSGDRLFLSPLSSTAPCTLWITQQLIRKTL